jgi:hypothetical protein
MFLVRALLVWFVMMGAEFCHGALRTLFLTPVMGDHLARQVSVFTGSALMVLVAYVFILWIRAQCGGEQVAVGALWVVLTVAFEMFVGHYILRMPWDAVLEDFNLFRGRLMPLGLLVLTFSPMIAARLRGRFPLK